MVDSAKELVGALGETFQKMGEATPDFMGPFKQMVGAAEKDGVLSTKVKELITVAIAVSARCPFCIAIHVKNAIDSGATRAEMIEAANVAVMMGGGPNATYMKYLFDAMDEFGAK